MPSSTPKMQVSQTLLGEFTALTQTGTLKMRDWKMRDWKIREQETYGTPRVA